MSASVFERLADRFSKCHDKISRSKIDSYDIKDLEHDIVEILQEAGKALFNAISSKSIELKDAPFWFHKLPPKLGDNDEGRFWEYWLRAVAWVAGNRRDNGIVCPSGASELMYHTRGPRSERYTEDSLTDFLHFHIRSWAGGHPVLYFEGYPGDRSTPTFNMIQDTGCALAKLSEDVCSYLADMLASKPEPAETERKKKDSVKKLLKIIVAIIGFLAALLGVFYYLDYFGWLERIKRLFTR